LLAIWIGRRRVDAAQLARGLVARLLCQERHQIPASVRGWEAFIYRDLQGRGTCGGRTACGHEQVACAARTLTTTLSPHPRAGAAEPEARAFRVPVSSCRRPPGRARPQPVRRDVRLAPRPASAIICPGRGWRSEKAGPYRRRDASRSGGSP
jgi:hypothetical protein